jgi:uncharacterized protein (TIRG00374 family)
VAGIVTIVVLLIVFVGVFPQFASYAEAWDSIQAMSAPWLVALSVAVVVNILVYVWPLQAAIPGLRYWPTFMVRQTSYAISNGVPAGGAIGLGVQYAMLESYGVGAPEAAAGIGINSVWNMIATLGLPIIAAILLVFTGQSDSQFVLIAVLGVVAIAVGAILLALVLHSNEEARRIGAFGERAVNWVLRIVHRHADLGLGEKLVSFRESTVDVIRARWALLTATNFLMQLTSFAILFIALRAIQASDGSTPTTFAECLAAFAFGRLASFIPIPPGGLGTVDAAIVAILSAFGATNADALAADLVWRAGTFIPQVVAGIITFVIWRRRQARRAASVASP